MSVKIMSKVFDTDLEPTKKLIMLALADNSNNEGICFPSINTIIKKTGFCKQTIYNNMEELIENGYIVKKKRNRKNGANSSNKYLLFPLENIDLLDEEDHVLFKDLVDNIDKGSLGDRLGEKVGSLGDRLANPPKSPSVRLQGEPSHILNHHLEDKSQKQVKPINNPTQQKQVHTKEEFTPKQQEVELDKETVKEEVKELEEDKAKAKKVKACPRPSDLNPSQKLSYIVEKVKHSVPSGKIKSYASERVEAFKVLKPIDDVDRLIESYLRHVRETESQFIKKLINFILEYDFQKPVNDNIFMMQY